MTRARSGWEPCTWSEKGEGGDGGGPDGGDGGGLDGGGEVGGDVGGDGAGGDDGRDEEIVAEANSTASILVDV